MMAAYHRDKGNTHKTKIIVPDSAHGTNPASAVIAGFEIVEIPSNEKGLIDLDAYRAAMNDSVAGIMTTCPNTHGLFESDIQEIARIAHEADALLYYDGANLNAIMGKCRPGDIGFDVMHYNLHKTFATPHGMGGPGSGAIGVGPRLTPYIPGPRVVKDGDTYLQMVDEMRSSSQRTTSSPSLRALRAGMEERSQSSRISGQKSRSPSPSWPMNATTRSPRSSRDSSTQSAR